MATRGKEKLQRGGLTTYSELRKKVINKMEENSRRMLTTISPKARHPLDSASSRHQPPSEPRKDSKSANSTERRRVRPGQLRRPADSKPAKYSHVKLIAYRYKGVQGLVADTEGEECRSGPAQGSGEHKGARREGERPEAEV